MSAIRPAPDAAAAIPELTFSVVSARALEPAAIPTLVFALCVQAPGGQPIRSIMLDVQLQIAARRRSYSPAAQDRLLELFGTPERWATTLRTLPWLRTSTVVPPFTGETVVELQVPCTYDLEVTAAKYLAALDGGSVPLEFLFSGSVFFTAAHGGLQTVRIGWQQEAEYSLPVSVWRGMMDRHFAHSAWLRLRSETLDRLCAYKARGTYATWEEAIDSLLAGEEQRPQTQLGGERR